MNVFLLQGTIRLGKPPTAGGDIPLYVIIIPIVVAPLPIVALGITLYFVSSYSCMLYIIVFILIFS